jgi:hypothetical protein
MTHSLHRLGNKEDLEKDFVVFTMSAKTVNVKGSAEKMQKFFQILEKYNPVNYGDMKTGNRFNKEKDDIYNAINDRSIVHFVYTDREIVGKILEELAEADLGTSVIVSGVIQEAEQLCRQARLRMHTVEFSGGIHGRTDLLPEKPVLEITTMCGHGMVAGNLVRDMVNKVKRGKKSLEEAAIELSKPCQCGIFNPKRAEHLLKKFL